MPCERAKPKISLFYPVYNDELTIRHLTEKSVAVLEELTDDYEILIINDGSRDRSGVLADELAVEFAKVRAIHHPRNLGYGRALRTGFENSQVGDWLCFFDGDDQYDVRELYHAIKLLDGHDFLATFRFRKTYGRFRVFQSLVYGLMLRALFGLKLRDVNSGFKLIRKTVADDVAIEYDSPFVVAEICLKVIAMGYRVGEFGISMYPRQVGTESNVTFRRVIDTIRDMLEFRRRFFSNSPRESLRGRARARREREAAAS